MNIFESLGLSLTSFAFFMINLAIIVAAMYYFLRKPISKIIKDQQQKLSDIYKENEEITKSATETKKEYEKLIANVRDEAMKISSDAVSKAQVRSDEIIEAANAQAKTITELAQADIEAERARIKQEFDKSVTEMSFHIAQKILAREVNEQDNKKIIDECLKGL